MIDKVIKGLTECVTAGLEKPCPLDCQYFQLCFPDVGPSNPFMSLMQDALTLLKEQEAVEPKHNPLSPTDWFCGKCGMCISRFHDYCPSCGRKVKWDDI